MSLKKHILCPQSKRNKDISPTLEMVSLIRTVLIGPKVDFVTEYTCMGLVVIWAEPVVQSNQVGFGSYVGHAPLVEHH